MWIGSTPLCLQDLTIPEQILISSGYLSRNLIQLTKRKHILKTKRTCYNTTSKSRKSKIIAALQWFFTHNKLFKEKFTIDKNALNLLPEGEISVSLTLTTTVLDINSQETEHYTDYSNESLFDYQESDTESKYDEIFDNDKLN
ncbi:hypothetical protein F8M41_022229 [Gigaspora margarita]|uniref:DUF6570 domain-containing protein n=1 Tax=Gigaspora margarita TaxID=4874 RepID=A0A8H4B1C1_GIGMA|nr:hypothetical protein F8M41_022229 [Gigaspora margarita]